MATAIRGLVIPERGPATITMNPNNSSITVTVTVEGCWIKPIKSGLQRYGQMNVQADQTLVKVPAEGLNPTGATNYQIRTGDLIVFNGQTYNVTAAGTTVKTVLTVWECVCKLVIQ